MSNGVEHDGDTAPRSGYGPHTSRHPIPTIQRYLEHKDEIGQRQQEAVDAQKDDTDESRVRRAYNSVKDIVTGEDTKHLSGDPYPTANYNSEAADVAQQRLQDRNGHADGPATDRGHRPDINGEDASQSHGNKGQSGPSATEAAVSESDPRQKRKAMKDGQADDGGREVTDPVTHLSIVIRDSTVKDLKRAPENEETPGAEPRTSTGPDAAEKTPSELDFEQNELQLDYEGMQKRFPPPNFDDARSKLARTFAFALTVGLCSTVTFVTLALVLWQMLASTHLVLLIFIAVVTASIGGGSLVWVIQGWLSGKVREIWDDGVWAASREQERQLLEESESHLPESTAWLNSLLASCWPLVNPDLFASLADELEDVMQASLPKLVRMVSVEDLGQGSEAVRILGVRWLPTAAAALSVDDKGRLKSPKDDRDKDRNTDGAGQIEDDEANDNHHDANTATGDQPNGAEQQTKKSRKQQQQEEEDKQAISEGMEAEQGDFVNLELAFAYRARPSGKSIKTKTKNAHLYLRFNFPGGLYFPVWVDLKGLVGTMRLRLQLTPDPPFFGLCTLTFLGQPRAELSCVPLNQRLLNIMNLPIISSFVQTSIDAALAEYVAPKSLTLNIKEMIAGDDFKKDTTARGVVRVLIKSARGFKEGDPGIGPIQGSSDPYVTVSWSKYGKTLASTRIIIKDQEPNWSEYAYVLCGPEEINAEENLRLQIWDSDKFTADDHLGRVEVDLKELMHSPKTHNQMCEREDRLCGDQEDEKMPGTLQWSVGYFAKARISDQQLERQSQDSRIKSRDDLKKIVADAAERKLREATKTEENKEIRHQEVQEYKEREDAMIISRPPSRERPSGILSIHIHNITGLEFELQNKRTNKEAGDREDESEESDDLPSSYATIILNHRKVYRTRTKPKSAKPFFNACTERFIRDWETTEVLISVRDSRERENDPLLGIVYLPLNKVFRKQSQSMDTYPLMGGIGYGRARISMVFRSVEMQLPKELLGWDYGTLEIKMPVRSRRQLRDNLHSYRLKLRTTLSRIRVHPDQLEWKPKKGNNGFLAVRKRYSTPLIAEWRSSNVLKDKTAAFAVMWFNEIPDEEEKTVVMQVWKGSKAGLKKATSCCDYAGIEENEKPLGEIEVTMTFWRGLSGYHKRYARKGKEHDMSQVMEALDTVNDQKERHTEIYDDDGDDDDDSDDDDDDNDSDSGDENENKGPSRSMRTAAHNHSEKEDLSTKQKLKNLFTPNHTHDDTDSADNGQPKENNAPNGVLSKLKDVLSDPNNSHADDDGQPKSNTDHTTPLTAPLSQIKDAFDSSNSPDDPSRGLVNEARDYKDHHRQLHRKNRGVMQFQGARTADWVVTKIRHGRDRLSGVFEHGERGPGVETEV